MIIRNLHRGEEEGLVCVSATIVHEAPTVREQVITFSVPEAYGEYMTANFEAFLIPAAPVALFHGESRIKVEGNVCPDLVDRLRAALVLERSWYGGDSEIPVITTAGINLESAKGNKTASFLSGGADSMSLLARNLQLYPVGHDKRIVTSIFVHGLDIGDPNKPPRHDIFDEGIHSFRKLEELHQIQVVPCTTNVRTMEPDWQFFERRHVSFALSGIAHALSGGIQRTLVALDNRVDNHHPSGNHPLISKYVSSGVLQFESGLDGFTRLEKYRFLVDLPGALDAFRVCFQMETIGPSQLNCGQCDKCVRAKMELLVCDALDKCSSFPDKSISVDRVQKMNSLKQVIHEFDDDLIRELPAHGSKDLADALAYAVAKTRVEPSPPSPVKDFVRRARRKAGKLLNLD